MAKDFTTISDAADLESSDKVLVGQASTDGVALLSKLKEFTVKPNLNGSQQNGIIIPMYIYPTDAYTNADYNGLITLKRQNRTIPMIAITNPNSGPGSVTDGNYTMVHNRMKAAEIHVAGYVSTNYRGNSVSVVKGIIDDWKTYYPEIDGIFFDEQSDGTTDLPTEIAYYQEVADYAREVGFWLTVSNPGTFVDNSFFPLFPIQS